MLKNRNLKDVRGKSAGFTIIEVLIVLAIAGLILLIVFLAVPALQRNARNTAMKTDVQNVLGGVSEFQGANNGSMPDKVEGTGDINYTKTASGSTPTSIKVQGSTQVSTAASGSTPMPAGNTTGPTSGTIEVYLGKKCDGTANTRATAVVYSVETSGNSTVRTCADS